MKSTFGLLPVKLGSIFCFICGKIEALGMAMGVGDELGVGLGGVTVGVGAGVPSPLPQPLFAITNIAAAAFKRLRLIIIIFSPTQIQFFRLDDNSKRLGQQVGIACRVVGMKLLI